MLSNAVKFTDVGEVQVDAHVLRRAQLPPAALAKLAQQAKQPAAFPAEVSSGGPPSKDACTEEEGGRAAEGAGGGSVGWQGGLCKAGLEAQARQEHLEARAEAVAGQDEIGAWASSGIYHRSNSSSSGAGTGPPLPHAGLVAGGGVDRRGAGGAGAASGTAGTAGGGHGGGGGGMEVIDEDAGYACSAPSSLNASLDGGQTAGERASGEVRARGGLRLCTHMASSDAVRVLLQG